MATTLAEDDAQAHVHGVCFKTGPPARVGIELEWIVHDGVDAHREVAPERLDEALAPLEAEGLPFGSGLTREPGGQVELSSPPADTLAGCARDLRADMTALEQALATSGLVLAGHGLEPYRNPPRIVDHPRYRAMEAYFDRGGSWGRMMMRGTASVQVNLDAGDESAGPRGYRSRWELTHRLGPVLVAAFANSPLWQGRPTGWRSTRQLVWARMDPGRTRPPGPPPGIDGDPRAAWARYALDAPLLCLRGAAAADWNAPEGLTFRSWLRGVPGVRPPTLDDLDYHLTTLFPPVRPRGWLELRMIDAQCGEDWIVPAAMAATLLDDPVAAEAAWAATEPLCADGATVPTEAVWHRAARLGPADPVLGKAILACFAATENALADADAPGPVRAAVAEFTRRYAERGRCPADDLLERTCR
ncbi:ergothioneine biosynthesis glutamate--cysteine ligase EgtA [Embleya hyalina]|uniref:Glutamate--cysteine ligase EgtA n=1 Tax=Embleya hyalina TaxID=516124 RepID=A0A401YY26_9ACTN|nr:ergothioneine biosynthesis glutamate--cysteine ligase EgtA [Embleya hyalina]GCD99522.1 glutamate--cysteine ligase EgtA [Embleya hyalina]